MRALYGEEVEIPFGATPGVNAMTRGFDPDLIEFIQGVCAVYTPRNLVIPRPSTVDAGNVVAAEASNPNEKTLGRQTSASFLADREAENESPYQSTSAESQKATL